MSVDEYRPNPRRRTFGDLCRALYWKITGWFA